MKPKSPEDCPACRHWVHLTRHIICRNVVPYAQRKSRRGRRKVIETHGRACLNPDSEYFGITDAAVHTLVGNGKGGQHGDIQHFRCQWCHTDFSARCDTPLYYLSTDFDCVTLVLCLLADGVDVAVLVRVTGHTEATISRWLQCAGGHGQRPHNQFFRQLTLALVQLDELYAKVRGVPEALWLSIDLVTKIIPPRARKTHWRVSPKLLYGQQLKQLHGGGVD